MLEELQNLQASALGLYIDKDEIVCCDCGREDDIPIRAEMDGKAFDDDKLISQYLVIKTIMMQAVDTFEEGLSKAKDEMEVIDVQPCLNLVSITLDQGEL